MKKQTILSLLLALLISTASFCAGRKQAREQPQESSGAIDPLKVTYGAGEKQTSENLYKQEEYEDSCQQIDLDTDSLKNSNVSENAYKQEEYVDSCQQIDLGTDSLKISNVKLVKEVAIENIQIEYPYLNNAGDEPSRKINEQIYDQIIYGRTKGSLTDNDGIWTDADIAYHVTYVDDNIISILFSGWIGGAGYQDVDVGLNFNLQSGEILSIADFYELEEIRDMTQRAVSEKLLTSENLILDGEQRETYFNEFLGEFDTDDYIKRTDNFFIKGGYICFIGSPPPSFKEGVYLELEVGEIPAIRQGDKD